jgi:hypothetical protein
MDRIPDQRGIRLLYSHTKLPVVFLMTGFFAVARGFPAPQSAKKSASSSAATSPADTGWQVVKDHAGKCQMSIPGDWKAVPGFGMASSAALHARAAVQSDAESSWSELKQTAKEILKPSKIVEDNSLRFSFVYATGKGKGFYMARSFTGYACIAQVDFDDGETGEKNSALATQMAGSVDKAR